MVYLARPSEGDKTSAGDVRLSPMRKTHSSIDGGSYAESVAGPGKETFSLCYHPVDGAIQMDYGEGSYGRFGRYEGCEGCGGCYALIQE